MDQKPNRVAWLDQFRQELEVKIQDLKQQIEEPKKSCQKKRHGKHTSTNDRTEKQERIKALQNHVEQLKQIEQMLYEETIIDDSSWNEFQSLLETLYENVDNPEHNDELKQIYDRIEGNYNSSQDQPIYMQENSMRLERFFQRQQQKKVEPINLNEIQQHQQLIDQVESFQIILVQNSHIYKLKMLETSFKNMPQGSDYYPPPSSKEKLSLKSLFPKYKMLTHQIFPKLEIETLFYIFYYHKVIYIFD